MKNKIVSFLLVIVPAILALILGPKLWPDPVGSMMPTSGQLPFFIIIGAVEALAFGFGILFLVRGSVWLKQSAVSKSLTMWTYLAIAWSLISWWPHDNFHRANGMSMQGLLYIEYGFHLTLIIAALIIATYFRKSTNRP